MKVTLSLLARRDLSDILAALARENRQAAKFLDARFTERFQQLARSPNIGRQRPDIAVHVRGLLVSPYVILYTLRSSDAFVLRVLHTSRDLNNTPLQ